MGLFSNRTTREIREITIKDEFFRITIIREKRKNSRVSITKTGINIRIPSFLSKNEQKSQIDKFVKWAKKTIEEKDVTFSINQKKFDDGDILKLYDNSFKIAISETKLNTISGKIKGDAILIKIPEKIDTEEKGKYISKIISKLIASAYKGKISLKLSEFNSIHQFGEINNVRMKNNSTNWGSCSSKNNINISIRLLLAPEWVVDYVLIHELSHLIHRNHSINFWNEVEKAYPNYRKAEKWLKLNASSCII